MDSHVMTMQAVVLEEFQESLEVQGVDRSDPEPHGVIPVCTDFSS
jgi:alcohol dehydrogenase